MQWAVYDFHVSGFGGGYYRRAVQLGAKFDRKSDLNIRTMKESLLIKFMDVV